MKSYLNRFLRFTERYTKTDMVYLTKGSFWLTIGQGIAILSSLLLSVVLAGVLDPEVYGNYKFILSLAGIIGGLSLSGLGTALTQAVARGADGTFYLAVKTQLRWGNVVALVALAMGLYYFLNNNITLTISLAIIAVTLPLTNSLGLYGSFISGKKDFKRGTTYWIIGQIINVATVMITAALTDNVIYLVAGYFISNFLVSAFFYKRCIAVYNPSHDTADKEMIRYGNHLSMMGFIGTFANQLDKILVFHFMGAAPLAIYSFASAIPEQMRGFLKNLFNVGTPKFALLDKPTLRKSITDKAVRLTCISLLIVIAYYFAAPYIYAILFPRYIEAVVYSQIYMIGMIIFPALSLFALYFQLMKEVKIMYILTVVGNVVTIILSLVLIPKYGILGAVIENTLSWTAMFLVNLFYFLRHARKENVVSVEVPRTDETVGK